MSNEDALSVNEPVSVESLILANHVEQVNGLLYISGGGWTDHHRRIIKGGPPPLSHLGIALVIAVPWHETNRQHSVSIEIRHEDAEEALVGLNATFNVGRPPTLRPGGIQYPTIALPMDIIFPSAGGYSIVVRIDDRADSKRHWVFQVHDIEQMALSA
jgi:Family of unknown function (DUF6941)